MSMNEETTKRGRANKPPKQPNPIRSNQGHRASAFARIFFGDKNGKHDIFEKQTGRARKNGGGQPSHRDRSKNYRAWKSAFGGIAAPEPIDFEGLHA